jgi:hypothetical protein
MERNVLLDNFKQRVTMKRIFLIAALVLSSSLVFAGTTKQKWTAGWDNFSEPLNYNKSGVSWSVADQELTVTFVLNSATPNKLYQVGLVFFCSTMPANFGQFPIVYIDSTAPDCGSLTRQGVTETVAGVGFGVVLTDIYGSGSVSVAVGPIDAGTYEAEFYVDDGAGCGLIGGAGNGEDCNLDFQSPGPTFGDTTTITIP